MILNWEMTSPHGNISAFDSGVRPSQLCSNSISAAATAVCVWDKLRVMGQKQDRYWYAVMYEQFLFCTVYSRAPVGKDSAHMSVFRCVCVSDWWKQSVYDLRRIKYYKWFLSISGEFIIQ